MGTLVAIAMLALSLFGPGWSSEHKAFWEWQLGHKLEGYQERRLSRGWHPDGTKPLFGSFSQASKDGMGSVTELWCTCVIGGGCICEFPSEFQ